MIDTCPKCNGKGERTRTKGEDGCEADPDLHPILAREPKLCERCLGAQRCELTQAEIEQRNVNKA